MKKRLALLIAVCFAAVSFASAQTPDIRGTWKLVAIDGKSVPADYSGIKLVTDTHFLWTLADAEGNIVAGAGGTYTLDGNKYSVSFDYVLPMLKEIQGEKIDFVLVTEGDRMSFRGEVKNKPYSQTWDRVN